MANSSVVIKMWLHSLFLGCILFALFLLYQFLLIGTLSLTTIAMAIAGTAAIMIGLSFALSGLCYYFDFFNRKIAYRKYIGLVGYWLALLYSIMLLFVEPEKYFYGFFDNVLTADVVLGLIAMTIFTFMAVISNNWAMKQLGVARWRYGLRLGYVAYFLLVVRVAILDHELWFAWIQHPTTLPPLRLLLAFFALCMIALRLSMFIKLPSNG